MLAMKDVKLITQLKQVFYFDLFFINSRPLDNLDAPKICIGVLWITSFITPETHQHPQGRTITHCEKGRFSVNIYKINSAPLINKVSLVDKIYKQVRYLYLRRSQNRGKFNTR